MPASNTFDTTNLGSAVANTEDLTRGAHLISPENTPLYSTLPKERATAIYHEWVLDDMDDPVATGVVEGADVTAFTDQFAEQARVGNYIQTQRRVPKVTDVQDLVDSAGGVNVVNAVKKALMELNRDTEKVIAGTQAQSAGTKGTARIAAGFGEMLGGSSSVFPADYECPSGSRKSATAVSESDVDGVIRSIFNESGNRPRLRLYADSSWLADFNSETIRLTTTTQTSDRVNYNVTGQSLNFRVRIYESQHGAVEVFDLNPKCSPDTTNLDVAYFINPEYACIAELGGLRRKELPDNDGGRRFSIKRHFTPVIKNARAHGYWASTT